MRCAHQRLNLLIGSSRRKKKRKRPMTRLSQQWVVCIKKAAVSLQSISTAAGREGINLQFARVLFNHDLPWNPMDLSLTTTSSCSRQSVLQCLAERFDGGGLAELADLLIAHDVLKSHVSADRAHHL